jgi:uncharacterized protein (UPF0248 family)
MQPIQQLLNRIRWDPRFRRGRFELGYYDRLARCLVTVPLEAITFPAGVREAFDCYDDEGVRHRIPLHRVRRVTRDGRVIWQRQPPGETSAG